jgi:hypothetical protein
LGSTDGIGMDSHGHDREIQKTPIGESKQLNIAFPFETNRMVVGRTIRAKSSMRGRESRLDGNMLDFGRSYAVPREGRA